MSGTIALCLRGEVRESFTFFTILAKFLLSRWVLQANAVFMTLAKETFVLKICNH
jgi:hypothetical protein